MAKSSRPAPETNKLLWGVEKVIKFLKGFWLLSSGHTPHPPPPNGCAPCHTCGHQETNLLSGSSPHITPPTPHPSYPHFHMPPTLVTMKTSKYTSFIRVWGALGSLCGDVVWGVGGRQADGWRWGESKLLSSDPCKLVSGTTVLGVGGGGWGV